LGKVLGRDTRYSCEDNAVGEGLGAVGGVDEGYEGLRGLLSLHCSSAFTFENHVHDLSPPSMAAPYRATVEIVHLRLATALLAWIPVVWGIGETMRVGLDLVRMVHGLVADDGNRRRGL